MPQPSVELPDPLHPPSVPAESTDDLLSQMAGDEINRLLINAGVEGPAEAVDAPSSPPAASPAVEPSTHAEVAGAPVNFGSLGDSADLDPSALPAIEPARLNRELDHVFDRQISEPTTPTAKQPTAQQPIAQQSSEEQSSGEQSPAPVAAPASDSPSAESVTALLGKIDAGERPPPPSSTTPSANQPSIETPAKAPVEAGAPATETVEAPSIVVSDESAAAGAGAPHALIREPRASLADRVLDRAAVVLDPFPDRTRDVVGKIAIVTAINATAVLIYVFFFRH